MRATQFGSIETEKPTKIGDNLYDLGENESVIIKGKVLFYIDFDAKEVTQYKKVSDIPIYVNVNGD